MVACGIDPAGNRTQLRHGSTQRAKPLNHWSCVIWVSRPPDSGHLVLVGHTVHVKYFWPVYHVKPFDLGRCHAPSSADLPLPLVWRIVHLAVAHPNLLGACAHVVRAGRHVGAFDHAITQVLPGCC